MRKLTESTYVLESPTNIGFIVHNNKVTLIDSGNDKESGRKIRQNLEKNAWSLRAIINTHSNADHIGGNNYLQRNVGCDIYASSIESMFIESPALETAFLWGGLEVKDLRNKFFHAKPSDVTHVIEGDAELENGLSTLSLKGHYFNQIGIMTPDKVLFLGDALFGEDILKKYKIPFIFDVRAYKQSIKKIEATDAAYYVPSHGPVLEDITELASVNIQLVEEIESALIAIMKTSKTYDEILKDICDQYGIDLNVGQYALVGSTIRSFLTYLHDEGKITYSISDNVMRWKNTQNA